MIELTTQEIVNAAILALVFTWLFQKASKFFKLVISKPTELDYQFKDITRIMQKCYSLFPREIVQFRGQVLKRGMNIRITTIQNKIYEGELIGLNNENMLCVMTSRNIVAHELDSIEEINVLDGDK